MVQENVIMPYFQPAPISYQCAVDMLNFRIFNITTHNLDCPKLSTPRFAQRTPNIDHSSELSKKVLDNYVEL